MSADVADADVERGNLEADGKAVRLAEQKFEPASRGQKNTSARSSKETSRCKWEARHAAEVRDRRTAKKHQSNMRSCARDAKHVPVGVEDEGSARLPSSNMSVLDRREGIASDDGAKALAKRLTWLNGLECEVDKRNGVLEIMKMGSSEYLFSSDPSEIVFDLQACGLVSAGLANDLVALLHDVPHDVASTRRLELPPERWLEHAKKIAHVLPLNEKPISASEIKYLMSIDEKQKDIARLKSIEEQRRQDVKEAQARRLREAEAVDWNDVASQRPTWDVPTSIKITNSPNRAQCLGTYYHAPLPFNIDVYKIEQEPWFLYYVARPEHAGWRVGYGNYICWKGGDADPRRASADRRSTTVSDTRWQGDGSHYLAQGDPPWQLEFSFVQDSKSRKRVEWDHWDKTGGCKKEIEMLPVSKVSNSDIVEGLAILMQETDFHHIGAITCETPTGVAYDITVFHNARISSMAVDGCTNTAVSGTPDDSESEHASQLKPVAVKMLSGFVATLELPPPHKVAMLKDLLAMKLNIPSSQQQIMDDSIELADEDVISVETLLLIRKDPPMIRVAEFLETLLHCIPAQESRLCEPERSLFKMWYCFDMYKGCPANPKELLSWLASNWSTESVPLTKKNLLGCFDTWLELQGRGGTHPEAFVGSIDKLLAFWEHYCYSPSIYQSHQGPLCRDDSLVLVFFIVGYLRHSSQTLLVNSIRLAAVV